MSTIGPTPKLPTTTTAHQCGMHAPTTAPTGGAAFAVPAGGFQVPSEFGSAATAPAMERFINSRAGGVIVGSDGAPAGRVPEGSFVDSANGKVYGPDSKEIELPAGATVDFFDLPDIDGLVASYAQATGGGTTVGDKGSTPTGKEGASTGGTDVAGQWGPGGVTDFAGSGPVAKGGGAEAPSKVAGASGGGDEAPATGPAAAAAPMAQIASLMDQLRAAMANLPGMAAAPAAGAATASGGGMQLPPGKLAGDPGMPPGKVGGSWGGPMHALGAVGALGGHPGSIGHALRELVFTLRELVQELHHDHDAPGKVDDAPPAKDSSVAGESGEPTATQSTDASTSTDSTSTDDTSTDTTQVGAAKDGTSTDDDTGSDSSDSSDATEATSTETST